MLAHIKDNRKQSVQEHLKNVANYSGFLGKKIGLEACGTLTGWLHDIGKMTTIFDNYIKNAVLNPQKGKKGPDHSTAGAVWVMTLAEKKNTEIAFLTAQMIAIVIMGHHGGLGDIIDLWGESPYIKRLNKVKEDPDWLESYQQVEKEMEKVLDIRILQDLFDLAIKEVQNIFSKLKAISTNAKELRYYCGILCKLLYSCLIDADRYDTASFMDNMPIKLPDNHQKLWEELTRRFEEKIIGFSTDTSINRLRHEISEQCCHNAIKPEGIYTLNCPTGSGKTMASLRFALHHAKKYHKDHIFYIIPFITITEQNAAEIKKILSCFEKDPLVEENILELHSAKENEVEADEINGAELVSERLVQPVIFTTMVRFLNIFFGSGTRNIRGAHQFSHSVIIFDEVQTLSPKCIAMFNALLNFLSKICGATIVLSTATQPLLDQTPSEIPNLMMAKSHELSGCTLEVYSAFKRTDFIDKRINGGYSSDRLSQQIWETAQKEGNVLTVFNTKAAVTELYQTLKEKYGEIMEETGYRLYVLTTLLYPKHRKQKIDEIRSQLRQNKKLIVISTQLIEAGVDISFKAVYRSLAGLDSVIQSGGRCNRHGENKEPGKVYLVNPSFEKLGSLEDIKKGRQALENILDIYQRQSGMEAYEINSLAGIGAYFKEYYNLQKENMTYKFKIDHQTGFEMYDLLSDNKNLFHVKYKDLRDPRIKLRQSFKSAGHHFKAIDDHGKPVIVSHGQAKALITRLLSAEKNCDRYQLLHQLQAYTVNISDQLFKKLDNAITGNEALGIYLLNESYYDETSGVTEVPASMSFYNF